MRGPLVVRAGPSVSPGRFPGNDFQAASAKVVLSDGPQPKIGAAEGTGPKQRDSRKVSVMNETTPTAAEPAELMKQLILDIVQALVDQPDDVEVQLIDDNDSTVIRLRVAHPDIGKVIGKQGRTARSLRTDRKST